MKSGEKIFRQMKQNSARVVHPTRRDFVKYHEKDSVDFSCDEFLEIPLYYLTNKILNHIQGRRPYTPLKPFLKEGFKHPKNFHKKYFLKVLEGGAGETSFRTACSSVSLRNF